MLLVRLGQIRNKYIDLYWIDLSTTGKLITQLWEVVCLLFAQTKKLNPRKSSYYFSIYLNFWLNIWFYCNASDLSCEVILCCQALPLLFYCAHLSTWWTETWAVKKLLEKRKCSLLQLSQSLLRRAEEHASNRSTPSPDLSKRVCVSLRKRNSKREGEGLRAQRFHWKYYAQLARYEPSQWRQKSCQ